MFWSKKKTETRIALVEKPSAILTEYAEEPTANPGRGELVTYRGSMQQPTFTFDVASIEAKRVHLAAMAFEAGKKMANEKIQTVHEKCYVEDELVNYARSLLYFSDIAKNLKMEIPEVYRGTHARGYFSNGFMQELTRLYKLVPGLIVKGGESQLEIMLPVRNAT